MDELILRTHVPPVNGGGRQTPDSQWGLPGPIAGKGKGSQDNERQSTVRDQRTEECGGSDEEEEEREQQETNQQDTRRRHMPPNRDTRKKEGHKGHMEACGGVEEGLRIPTKINWEQSSISGRRATRSQTSAETREARRRADEREELAQTRSGGSHFFRGVMESDEEEEDDDPCDRSEPKKLLPLMNQAEGRQPVYVPWKQRDLKTLCDCLPPLSDGGSKWIRMFEQETASDNLCLGDLRGILFRLEGGAVQRKIDQGAGTYRMTQETLFNNHRGAWWEQIRTEWPTSANMDAMAGLKREPGEETHKYLKRAAALWLDNMGSRPDKSDSNKFMWRAAVIAGLDKAIQDDLGLVVGLCRMSDTIWREHIVHYVRRYDKAKDTSEEESKKLALRLLKLQISKEEEEVDKSKPKKIKQMLQGEAPSLEAQLPPQPLYYPPQQGTTYAYLPPAWQQSQHPYPENAPYGYGRGQPPMRGRGRGNPTDNICHRCGQVGHWARGCPSGRQPAQYQTPPQQPPHSGRGQNRPPGPPAQTAPGPQGQYPLTDGGPEPDDDPAWWHQ